MTEAMTLDSEVRAAVEMAMEKLGDLGSAEAIAKFLAAEGIRGVRAFSTSCPIAVYLSRVVGKPVVVGEHVWSVLDVGRVASGDNPPAVRGFIESFDDFRRYPELVHEGA